jgi:hypothetical protein
MLREALRRMGREDLIGGGKHQLVPSWQPAGTGLGDERGGRGRGGPGARGAVGQGGPRGAPGGRSRIQPGVALTQHTGLPPRKRR